MVKWHLQMEKALLNHQAKKLLFHSLSEDQNSSLTPQEEMFMLNG